MRNAARFVGFTKIQFIVVILTLVAALSGVDAYLIARNAQLSSEGAQSHVVLCTLKRDYSQRREDSRAFLAMTPKQRAQKLGPAFGAIPDSVIQQSLRGLDSNIKAMRRLKCT